MLAPGRKIRSHKTVVGRQGRNMGERLMGKKGPPRKRKRGGEIHRRKVKGRK